MAGKKGYKIGIKVKMGEYRNTQIFPCDDGKLYDYSYCAKHPELVLTSVEEYSRNFSKGAYRAIINGELTKKGDEYIPIPKENFFRG